MLEEACCTKSPCNIQGIFQSNAVYLQVKLDYLQTCSHYFEEHACVSLSKTTFVEKQG